jgi:hypothetical protein
MTREEDIATIRRSSDCLPVHSGVFGETAHREGGRRECFHAGLDFVAVRDT